jgi:hypothetical protein
MGRKADYVTQTMEELTHAAQSEFRKAQHVLKTRGGKRPFDKVAETPEFGCSFATSITA